MFAVIFEVEPRPEQWREYLDLAALLRPELERIDGFIDNERFADTRGEGRVLSLSTWRDEKALIRWRTQALHHQVQGKGRSRIFADYHLRVGEILADTAVPGDVPSDAARRDETETGRAKAVTISESGPQAEGGDSPAAALARLRLPETGTRGVVGRELYESIGAPGKSLLLASWSSAALAAAWQDRVSLGEAFGRPVVRHRTVSVIRDYGMFDRREAPQFHPPVEAARVAGAR